MLPTLAAGLGPRLLQRVAGVPPVGAAAATLITTGVALLADRRLKAGLMFVAIGGALVLSERASGDEQARKRLSRLSTK